MFSGLLKQAFTCRTIAQAAKMPVLSKRASERQNGYLGLKQPWLRGDYDSVIGLHGGGNADSYELSSSPVEQRLPFFTMGNNSSDAIEDGWRYFGKGTLQAALKNRKSLYSMACNSSPDGVCPKWYDALAGGSLQRVVMQPKGRLSSPFSSVIPSSPGLYKNVISRIASLARGEEVTVGPLHDYRKQLDNTWKDTGPVKNRWHNYTVPAGLVGAGAYLGGSSVAAPAAGFAAGYGVGTGIDTYIGKRITPTGQRLSHWWADRFTDRFMRDKG